MMSCISWYRFDCQHWSTRLAIKFRGKSDWSASTSLLVSTMNSTYPSLRSPPCRPSPLPANPRHPSPPISPAVPHSTPPPVPKQLPPPAPLAVTRMPFETTTVSKLLLLPMPVTANSALRQTQSPKPHLANSTPQDLAPKPTFAMYWLANHCRGC